MHRAAHTFIDIAFNRRYVKVCLLLLCIKSNHLNNCFQLISSIHFRLFNLCTFVFKLLIEFQKNIQHFLLFLKLFQYFKCYLKFNQIRSLCLTLSQRPHIACPLSLCHLPRYTKHDPNTWLVRTVFISWVFVIFGY